MLYNLTLHRQDQLAELDTGFRVEVEPRLRPVKDPTNYGELKRIVKEAVRQIPAGSDVLIGGLGQFQALIMQLPFKFYFANFDPVQKRVVGLIEHEPFTRQELFEIEAPL